MPVSIGDDSSSPDSRITRPSSKHPYNNGLRNTHNTFYAPSPPTAITAPFTSLPLFHTFVPDPTTPFDPSSPTTYLDGKPPAAHFPGLIRPDLGALISSIKDSLLHYAYAYAHHHLLKDTHLQLDPSTRKALESSLQNKPLWKALLCAQRYNDILPLSRTDARHYTPIIQADPTTASQIHSFLSTNGTVTRLWNAAIRKYIEKSARRRVLRIEHKSTFLTPGAIVALGPRRLAVRKQDFHVSFGRKLLSAAEPKPFYDLASFAHLLAASLSPPLYRAPFWNPAGFAGLPECYTRMLTPTSTSTTTSTHLSETLLLEILDGLWNELVQSETRPNVCERASYDELVHRAGFTLTEYLLSCREAWHAGLGQWTICSPRLTIYELLLLAGHRMYSCAAAEVEQKLYTRVGTESSALLRMSGPERIEAIAGCEEWGYWEVRHTLKQRALMRALEGVARSYQEEGGEGARLARVVWRALRADSRVGEQDLWVVLSGCVQRGEAGECPERVIAVPWEREGEEEDEWESEEEEGSWRGVGGE